jgi:UDP-N-acetylmuramate dehydrogenase
VWWCEGSGHDTCDLGIGVTTFAELTTLRVGGKISRLITATTENEILDAANAGDLLVLSGGSNLLVSDDGYPGTVLNIATQGKEIESDACSGAMVKLSSGEDWDSFVAYAVENGLAGIETLAGIPGLVGAAAIQNIGAYGSEISESIAKIRVFDRATKTISTMAASDCAFAYRTSQFKVDPDRWIVLDVTLQLRMGSESNPIKYQELADALGIKMGERAPLDRVRETVINLRKKKGMVLDPYDRDTWSAGSFFTNPIVDSASAARLPENAPTWTMLTGVKVSAAWLIEKSGFTKGYRVGGAAISRKHSLALINAENATASDLIALANQIRSKVFEGFGILLQPEVRLVGLALD